MESRLWTLAMAIFTLLVVAVACAGTIEAAAACVVAGLVLGLAAVGMERMAFLSLAAAFGTAPMYRGIGGISDVATPTDAFILLGLLLLAPMLTRRKSRAPGVYVAALGVLAITGLLGSAANSASVSSIAHILQWLLYIGVLPVALAMWYPGRRVVDRLLGCYLAGHMVSLAVAMMQGPAVNGRYQGLAHHPNDFGLAGAVAVAIVLYLLPQCRSPRVKVLLLGVMLASLGSIIFSGSRGATLATAAVVVLVPLVERSSVWTFLGLAAGALGLALLPYILNIGGQGGSLSRLAGDSTASYSDSLRQTGLADGWHRFLSAPYLGTGLDADVGLYHNVFLEVAVAVGVFGLFAYLVILYVLTRPLLTTHPLRRLSYIPWAFVVAGITLPGIVDRTSAVPMAIAIMAAVTPSLVPEKEPAQPLTLLRGAR